MRRERVFGSRRVTTVSVVLAHSVVHTAGWAPPALIHPLCVGNISYVIYDDKDNLGPISHVGRARTAYNLHECVMTGRAIPRLRIALVPSLSRFSAAGIRKVVRSCKFLVLIRVPKGGRNKREPRRTDERNGQMKANGNTKEGIRRRKPKKGGRAMVEIKTAPSGVRRYTRCFTEERFW